MSKEKTLRTSEETEVMQATGVPAQETEEVSTALATEIITPLPAVIFSVNMVIRPRDKCAPARAQAIPVIAEHTTLVCFTLYPTVSAA